MFLTLLDTLSDAIETMTVCGLKIEKSNCKKKQLEEKNNIEVDIVSLLEVIG